MEKESNLLQIPIQEEMKDCFIDYAMSVIVSRALPDVRDGLKPVHRRILYAMYEQGFHASKPYRKSARIVGEVLGKYHPHGDQAVYSTMVRMVQHFSLREPLIDGHGNFGSIDGDSPAAARYTEARMSKISETLLKDIEKDTVDWQGNFDDSLKEPLVLPAKFPNLLVNGSSGIAVGMATNIPPHNLGEVVEGTVALIRNPELPDMELFEIIKGPDFPTGALILGWKGISSAFHTGRGSIVQRAVVDIEEEKNNNRLIVTELPYQVNKANLIISMADQVKDKKIEGIRDIRDESDRSGMRLVIELKRDADPNVVLNTLYKRTQLQNNFGVINLVLVDNRPILLPLRGILQKYIEHAREVIRRRTIFDLKKAEERAHILQGLMIALKDIDAVIALIRSATDTRVAREQLMTRFDLSSRQAKAILEMRLQSLTGLEREKIEQELEDLLLKIQDFKDILNNPARVDEIVINELEEVKTKFANPRRSKIIEGEGGEIEILDLIPDEPCIITITTRGYIKRSPLEEFRSMGRGRKGVTGADLKEDDALHDCFVTTTHGHILVFTTLGRVYKLRAFKIPEYSRNTVGKYVTNLCAFQPGEGFNTILCIKDFDNSEDRCIIFCTRKGIVKRTLLTQFENVKENGKIAIELGPGDELIDVRLVSGNANIILSTSSGMCIRFPVNEVRPTGRVAMGVRGIKLKPSDSVVAMEAILPEEIDKEITILTVTKNGYGKKTRSQGYTIQHRGGSGVIDIITDNRNGEVMAMRKVRDGDEMLIVSQNGKLIRTKTDGVRAIGRRTKGVRLFSLSQDDSLTGLAILKRELLEDDVEISENPGDQPVSIDKNVEDNPVADNQVEVTPENSVDDSPEEDD
ncbi:DNA gyrase subunit A [Candidatus Riflebacteria bacterium]